MAVRRIDHLSITTADPRPVLSAFGRVLGLEVITPIRSFSRGDFEVILGLLFAGNVAIEFIRHEGSPAGHPPAYRVDGISFEPGADGIDAAVATLRARGIQTTPVMRASRTVWWNSAIVLAPETGLDWLFFTEYDWALAPESEPSATTDERRAVLAAAFNAEGGGPLGVVGVVEVDVGGPDPLASQRAWQAILGPSEPVRGVWDLGEGPRLRHRPADQGSCGLTVAVRSLDQATEALAKLPVPVDATHPGEILIDPADLFGLRVALVEARRAEPPTH